MVIYLYKLVDMSVKYDAVASGDAFNQAATLLLSGEEGVVKHLYSRSPDAMSLPALLGSMVFYIPCLGSVRLFNLCMLRGVLHRTISIYDP